MAGRSLVQKGLAAEGAIDIFATLVEETTNKYGESSIETAPTYYEYGNALLRGAAAAAGGGGGGGSKEEEEEEPPADARQLLAAQAVEARLNKQQTTTEEEKAEKKQTAAKRLPTKQSAQARNRKTR